MKAPRVLVVEPALPAPLFGRVARAVRALGDRGLARTYRTTFWLPRGAAPSCVVEEAILLLWAHVPRDPRVRGVEWWLSRMRTSSVGVDFHRDHDIVLRERGGPELHPRRASVLYLSRCRGGLLAVTADAPNPHNPACAPDAHDFDLVAPAPNRYAHFAGHLTHGVLDAKNQLPGARLPREPGLRLAVAVNFWARRPAGARRWAERPLQLAGRARDYWGPAST